MTITLQAQPRDSKENLQALREQGMVPGVYYGAGKQGTFATPAFELQKAVLEAGESTVIKLATPEGDLDVLVQDYQRDGQRGTLLHVDFKVIDMNKPVQVPVSLAFTGESPAEKTGAGTVNKVQYEVEIEAIAKNLPSEIEVSLDGMENVGDQITAGDLKLPAGVTLLTDTDETLVVVAAIKEEAEEESGEIDMDAIEASGEKGDSEEAAAEGGE